MPKDSTISYKIPKSKPYILAFSGKSNSGKTTLICKLCMYFKSRFGLKIAVIKHDPKDKAIFDNATKDSAKFFTCADAVSLVSPTRTVVQIHNNSLESKKRTLDSKLKNQCNNINQSEIIAFEKALEIFKMYDLIFVEGLKSLPYPRIVVARGHIDESYIPFALAFVVDENVDNIAILPKDMPVLRIEDIAHIADFICEMLSLRNYN